MTNDAAPARLGIAGPLVPRFAAVGWIGGDGLVTQPARELLLTVRRGPEMHIVHERLNRSVTRGNR